MLVGYARVSTADQALEPQTDALTAHGCEKLFTDIASGARTVRPGLGQAVEFCRPGDTLVVWKLDRLGRSMSHLIATVRALEEHGVGFRSLTEHVDTTTPGGRLIFHVFGALAEFERGLIQERVQAGLKAARARGRTGGRPPRAGRDASDGARVVGRPHAVRQTDLCAARDRQKYAVQIREGTLLTGEKKGGRLKRAPRNTGGCCSHAPAGPDTLHRATIVRSVVDKEKRQSALRPVKPIRDCYA